MKTKLIIIWLVLSSCLWGCQSQTNTSNTEVQPTEGSSFKVALLLPRVVEADAWTRAGYAGLRLIEKELGAKIDYQEAIPEAEFEQVFQQYAEDGFDYIIGHGGQFVPAAEIVAEEFPRIKFVVVTKYGGNNKNLGGLSLREGELAYLAGAIAAIKTKSNKVGYLGGVPYAIGEENMALFERGVKDTQPTVEVTIDWTGSWTDTVKAEQLAQTQIDSGVDVMVVYAGEAGLGVHPLAEQAGIFTVGSIEDQHNLAPKAVLTSSIQDIPVMILRGATLAKQGRWEGKQYKFGLLEGAQYLAPYYGLVSPEEAKQIELIKHDIIARKIDVTP